jgi:PDZ domain-containing secreted protein/Zn-dependent protease
MRSSGWPTIRLPGPPADQRRGDQGGIPYAVRPRHLSGDLRGIDMGRERAQPTFARRAVARAARIQVDETTVVFRPALLVLVPAALWMIGWPSQLSIAHRVAVTAVSATGFFGVLLLVEAARVAARARAGRSFEMVYLWPFGGVPRPLPPPPDVSLAELRRQGAVTAVAATASGVLATVCFLIAAALHKSPTAAATLSHVGWFATITGAANLLPALPLDAGRVLAAAVSARLRNAAAGAYTANRSSIILFQVLVAVSLGCLLGLELRVALVVGVAAGLLVRSYVVSTREETWLRVLGHRTVDEFTNTRATVPSDLPLAEFIELASGPTAPSVFAVVDEHRRPVGTASLASLASRRAVTTRTNGTVGDGLTATVAIQPGSWAAELPTAVWQAGAPVADDDAVHGVVDPQRLAPLFIADRARGSARRPWGGRTATVLWCMVFLVVALLHHPRLEMATPGHEFDVSSASQAVGVQSYPVSGRYLAVSALSVRSTWPHLLSAFLRDPSGVSALTSATADKKLTALLPKSSSDAVVAATRLANGTPQLSATGIQVVALEQKSQAPDGLLPGDEMLAINDAPTVDLDQLAPVMARAPAGSVRVTYRREGRVGSTTIDRDGSQRLGIIAAPARVGMPEPLRVDLVKLSGRGPSAGLAYALTALDLLTPIDLARGRTIAATGTIDENGNVGPIGALRAKSIAARRDHADLFLVPAGEPPARLAVPVTTVRTLNDAVAVLLRRSL